MFDRNLYELGLECIKKADFKIPESLIKKDTELTKSLYKNIDTDRNILRELSERNKDSSIEVGIENLSTDTWCTFKRNGTTHIHVTNLWFLSDSKKDRNIIKTINELKEKLLKKVENLGFEKFHINNYCINYFGGNVYEIFASQTTKNIISQIQENNEKIDLERYKHDEKLCNLKADLFELCFDDSKVSYQSISTLFLKYDLKLRDLVKLIGDKND